jgi:hypothetical protein
VTVSISGTARAFISLGTTRKTEQLEALNAASSVGRPGAYPDRAGLSMQITEGCVRDLSGRSRGVRSTRTGSDTKDIDLIEAKPLWLKYEWTTSAWPDAEQTGPEPGLFQPCGSSIKPSKAASKILRRHAIGVRKHHEHMQFART